MKKLIFFLSIILFVSFVHAQSDHDTLNINNWNVLINALNFNFCNLDSGIAAAEIPAGSGVSSIFSGNFWIGGLDSTNQLHVSADRYYASGGCFHAGPVADTYDSVFYNKYNRVWKINKSEITYHINHWNDPGYTMPEVIENWPGNGNMANGEAPVLAPYVDANGNSIYDPQNGDYPYMLGDQAIYYILNDKNNMDTLLNPMGLEIHVMVFAFQDTGVINNTFFMHFDIINYSSTTYHDVLWGVNTDIDIGNAFDDYIGSDTTQNMYFGYNGDSNDENYYTYLSDSSWNITDSILRLGYGTYPPALGVVFLTHTMQSFMAYTNGGGSTGDPQTGTEYYEAMQSYWKDGSHLQYGGTGHLTGGPDANFIFPEYSGWTEVSAGNTPDDRRGIASISIGNISVNSCFTADVAYVWARDTISSDNSVSLLLSQVPQVVQFVNQLGIDSNCTYLTIYNSINNPYSHILFFNIFPNPATDIVNIKTNLKNYTVAVYSQIGQKLMEKKNPISLDVQGLKSGIYLMRITDGKNTDWRKLIVE